MFLGSVAPTGKIQKFPIILITIPDHTGGYDTLGSHVRPILAAKSLTDVRFVISVFEPRAYPSLSTRLATYGPIFEPKIGITFDLLYQ